MRIRIVLILFIIFSAIITNLAFAQSRTKIDSAIRKIENSSEAEKIKLYLFLADQFIYINADSSVFYGKLAVDASKNNDDRGIYAKSLLSLGEAYYYADSLVRAEKTLLKAIPSAEKTTDTILLFNLYNYLTYVYFESFNYNEALKYQNLSIKLETGMEDKEETAARLNEYGMVYEYTGNIEKAQAYYIQSLKLYRELNNKEGIADLLNNLGNINQTLNNYEKALEYYLESLNLQNEIKNLQGVSIAENNIGIVYHDWGQYDKALEYYKRGLKTEKLLENENGISESLLNIAVVYHDLNKLDTALKYYNKSLEIAKSVQNMSVLSIIYGNIADLFFTENKMDSSLIYQERSLEYSKQMGNEIAIGESYLMLGEIYYKKNEFGKSLYYFNKSLSILKPRNILLSTADCYKGLADLYAAKNMYKKAFEYYKLYHDIKDSVFSENMANKLNILEIENREQEIKLINEARERGNIEKEYIENRIKIQRVIGAVLMVALVVIITLLLVLLFQLKSKRKAFSTLKKQHEEIKKNKDELIVAKEKAEESNKLKSAFLMNLSHEIRTPMNGIIGFSQILTSKNVDQEEISVYAEQINESSHKLLNILNSIIDISSIQTGQLKIIGGKVFLKGFLEDVYSQYQSKSQLSDGSVDFKLELNCDESLQVNADNKRLHQVLGHILSNAFKYTEKGEVKITCQSTNEHALISISDTGIGIPEEKLSLIFDKFTQLDYSSTRKYEGAGIGLALSKALLELMNGSIEVQSEPGKGSTFTVKLPVSK